MWERGARHNPATFRYRFYLDHRPILPQDPTLSFWRKSYNQYRNIYFGFMVAPNKVKYIFSNNIPVHDREDLKTITEYDNIFRKNLKYFSALAALYLSGFVFNSVNLRQNYMARIALVAGAYMVLNALVHKSYLNYLNDITSYYYYKYQHLAVEDIRHTADKRRSYYALDKSVYYRETSQDIRNAAHHPASLEHDHDTSTYYGPYPYDDHLNLEEVEEINKKFTEGTCKYDTPENELILGDPIDIKRIIRQLPTAQDYRKLI